MTEDLDALIALAREARRVERAAKTAAESDSTRALVDRWHDAVRAYYSAEALARAEFVRRIEGA